MEKRILSLMTMCKAEINSNNLAKVDNIESSDNGYKYSFSESNIKIGIFGKDSFKKTLLIYGGKSKKEVKKHLKRMSKELREEGIDISFSTDLKIRNLAVGGRFETKFNLMKLFSSLKDSDINVEYEPEQFPAVFLYLEDPSCTFLLFSTGKYVLQGLKSKSEIQPAIRKVKKVLKYT
ncbi:hypothetical protein C9439_02170 [archaeon SCG-AAA382B04]|nr:hypothetical protein C9439_02170 [archaeon SCG-AAA382B04]